MTEIGIEQALEVVFLDENFCEADAASSTYIKLVLDNGTVQLLQWEEP
jgi:hypothetical protein